jgi:hypothetical protein
LKRICSVKRGYAPQWQRICTGHILFEEDMQDISSLKRICSKRGYAPQWQRICTGHILFEEDMLRTYPL